MTLLICRTCARYDSRGTGEFGRAMAAAIAEHPGGTAVTVRKVQCLGSCPDHGVAAVDGPGKARVRFSRLDAGHAAAVIAAAAAHDSCESGAPEDWTVPSELADRISGVTPKRGPAGW